jgi:hypothetical protein
MTKTDYQETTEYKKSPRKVVIHAFVLAAPCFFSLFFVLGWCLVLLALVRNFRPECGRKNFAAGKKLGC